MKTNTKLKTQQRSLTTNFSIKELEQLAANMKQSKATETQASCGSSVRTSCSYHR